MSKDTSVQKSEVNQAVSVSADSITESEALLSEHIVLLKKEALPINRPDLFNAVGYTPEHSVLEGHEQAFTNIRQAQQRATDFLQEKKEEICAVLNDDKELGIGSNLLESDYMSCGPFHDFVDGKPVCQVHLHCYCVVCHTSATNLYSRDTVTQQRTNSSQEADHLLEYGAKSFDSNRNTHNPSAEILFENFFQTHKKLPFNVSGAVSSKMSNGTAEEGTEHDEAQHQCETYERNMELENDQVMFNSLPYEIIQKVFSYFSHYELAHTAALVCKKWKQFVYDPIHWTSLSIEREMSSYDFACLVKRTPLLRELYLCGQCIGCDEILFIVQCCPLLRLLDLGFVSTLFDGFISVIAQHCHHLEYLNVEGCIEFNTRCMGILCEDGRIPKLKGLNVSHCTKLTDESILTLVMNKEHLEMLNVDGISWLTDATLISIAECRGETLRALYVDGAELTLQTVQAIATNCPHIETISWSFAELLLDSALVHIKQMGSLRELILKKGMELTDEGAQMLFDEESQLKNLKKLDLSEWTNMGDDGVAALSNCCGPELTHLSLCWCWNITDAGLKCIIDKCKNVTDLDLLGIDKIKGHCMVDIPRKMPHLKRLHLRQCNKIDDDLIVEIVKTMPKVRAYNYYGDEFEVKRTLTSCTHDELTSCHQ